MKIIVVTLLLCLASFAAPAQKEESTDLLKMELTVRVAAVGLQGKSYRVVLAAEDNGESIDFRHWIVTIQRYPADYKIMDDQTIGVILPGPPCQGPTAEYCSMRGIPSEPLFRGRFDPDRFGHFRTFDGSITKTAAKMSAFREQLKANQQWTQAEIAAALAAAGARYGPDKEKEFTASLSSALKTLEEAFGPMRLHKVSSMKPTFPRLESMKSLIVGWPAYWKVIMVPLRKPKDRVVMYFEPFEGELQQLVVTGLFQKWDTNAKKYKWEYLDPDEK